MSRAGTDCGRPGPGLSLGCPVPQLPRLPAGLRGPRSPLPAAADGPSLLSSWTCVPESTPCTGMSRGAARGGAAPVPQPPGRLSHWDLGSLEASPGTCHPTAPAEARGPEDSLGGVAAMSGTAPESSLQHSCRELYDCLQRPLSQGPKVGATQAPGAGRCISEQTHGRGRTGGQGCA